MRKRTIAGIIATALAAAGLAGAGLAQQGPTPAAPPPFPTSPPLPSQSPTFVVMTPTTEAPRTRTPLTTFTPRPTPLTLPTTSPAASKLEPSTVFKPLDQFDFNLLPDVDESKWVTYTGELKTFSVKAPPDWKVDIGPARELFNGGNRIVGDTISLRKPLAEGIREGFTTNGYVEIQLSTTTFRILTGPSNAVKVREFRWLPQTVAPGGLSGVGVLQEGQSTERSSFRG
jgi:hypothetical protein